MALEWKVLADRSQLDELLVRSHERLQIIFKHSTRCEISAIAKYRLETDWNLEDQCDIWYLDLIQYRSVSDLVAESLSVSHESPQIILILNGESIHDASHLDISVSEIREAIAYSGRSASIGDA
ncbi:MAG: bacillithiol system redox-active protein YtxJ [Saprospiraceae bacterium]